MTTYNESDGGYRHPDHIMCHKISVAAFDAASDPDAYPDLGAAWQPLKLYYSFTFHRARTVALDRAMVARGLESPYTERLRDGLRIPSTRRGSRRGLIVPTISISVTTHSWPTRPRSIQTGRGLLCRSLCTSRRGLPRNGSSCAAWLIRASLRTICSQESLSPWRVEFQHDSFRRRHDPSRRRPERRRAGLGALAHHDPLGHCHGLLYFSMRKQFRKIRMPEDEEDGSDNAEDSASERPPRTKAEVPATRSAAG